MSAANLFKAVRTVGTALPAEAIPRANELRMPGQSAEAYQLSPGMAVNGAIARAWEAMLAAHRAWRAGLARLPDGDAATKLTRDKWLLPMLYELGWGRPDVVSACADDGSRSLFRELTFSCCLRPRMSPPLLQPELQTGCPAGLRRMLVDLREMLICVVR